MKKTLYILYIALFSTQFIFAQTSENSKIYVKNMGIKEKLSSAKHEMLFAIKTEKQSNFTQEFDQTIDNFIISYIKLVDENFNDSEIKAANKTFNETQQLVQPNPKNSVVFEEEVNILHENLDLSLQSIIVKYTEPAFLDSIKQK